MSEAPVIQNSPLPYSERLQRRGLSSIRLLVIHCTELPNLETARAHGERVQYEDTQTGNSGHYYIDRDGSIHQFVPLERVAHHVSGLNADSVGIELVNLGRYPVWHHSAHQNMTEDYTAAQMDALIALVHELESTLPKLQKVAGHEDLDRRQMPASDDPDIQVPRKMDPGPRFPWDRLLETSRLKRIEAGPA
jgi:N-acetylmuramoyl-L-alanine amidase